MSEADPSGGTTLGSVAVAIGGDLAPLIAKIEEARSIVMAFDRDMANGSSGLISFTEKARGAGTAMEENSTKTATAGRTAQTTADQVNKLSDANERAARASKAAGDAAETEAQKTERLSGVVDRAMRRLQERQELTSTMTGRSLSGITSAGIPADYVADQVKLDAQMGLEGGKIPGAALAGAATAGVIDTKVVKEGTKALEEEGKVIEELGHKTKISSFQIREMLVLMREAGRGDFTRMAGSATLLGQSFGLIDKLGAAGTFSVLGLVAAVATFGIAAVQGSREANQLGNELQLTGGKAGFTADSFIAMSEKIADSTRTSVGSNRELMRSLTETNDFTKDQIEALVTAAQRLSKATGESADDIEKDFAKMALDPVKYAEAFQHAHTDIISPVQMAHLRELQERGEKEEALGELIKIVTDGIAQNTADNISMMQRLWEGFIASVKNGWQNMKDMFAEAPTQTHIAELTDRIRGYEGLFQRGGSGNAYMDRQNDATYKRLVNERAVLQGQVNAQEASAAARQRDAEAADRQNQAINRVNDTYNRGIDSTHRYTNDLQRLNHTLADSVRMSRDAPIGEVLAAAAKSSDAGVRDLAAHYEQAADRIKKQDLPLQFRADAKAAREAAAEAHRLERAAEALERRRQSAIDTEQAEVDTLEALLPLYRNHEATEEDIGRAKAITTALTKVKLSAETEEGRVLADLVGKHYDLNKAIQDETKMREILRSMMNRSDDLETEAQLIGKSGWALAFEEAKLRALQQAMKDHIPITDDFMAAIEGGARKVADATVSVDAAKFFDDIEKTIRAIDLEKRTMGQSADTIDLETIRLRLLNDAKEKHIELTEENIAKIDEEARKIQNANADRGKARRGEEYSPSIFSITGQDYHELDQSLGGKFKQSDDLRRLENEQRRKKAVLAQYHRDGLIDEKRYQKALAELERQGAAERIRIMHETAQMQLAAGQQIADSMASIAGSIFGEQSKAYRAMFDLSKAFSIAKASLAMFDDIAQAASKGWPQNIPLIAQAAAEGAAIIADIRSIALTFAEGGYVAGAGTGTSDSIPAYLSNGEFVINAAQTAQWRPMLEAINAGRTPSLAQLPMGANDLGPRVTVHNHASGVEHEVHRIGPNEVEIIAKRVVRRDAPKVVAADMANPNSSTSKALTRHTTTGRRRA